MEKKQIYRTGIIMVTLVAAVILIYSVKLQPTPKCEMRK
jgi:hypothetical protein